MIRLKKRRLEAKTEKKSSSGNECKFGDQRERRQIEVVKNP